jgi:hypothetical protein
MVTVGWNPSTLKLFQSATGKICASCCGSGPMACPSSYTVSFTGISAAPPPVPLPFQTNRGYGGWYGGPYAVTYNGQAYMLAQDHFADQWWPQCWTPYNFYYPISNGTYNLPSLSTEGNCYYGLRTNDINISLGITNNGITTFASVSMSARHSLYSYDPSWGYAVFDGKVEGVAPTWCPVIPNLIVAGDCIRMSAPPFYYGVLSGAMGIGGTVRIFPGAFPGWTVNTGYQVGNIVCHLAEKYTCTQNHYSTIANEPGVGSQWSSYWSVSTVC